MINLGKIAYDTYGELRNWTTVGNKRMPAWESQSEELRNTWTAAAEAVFSLSRLASAFTEWDRRFREEPERFRSEAARMLKDTPESYGEACAPYFLALFTEEL